MRDPALARCLAAGRGTTFLSPYFDGPTSVSEAAEHAAEFLAKTHYWTRRWLDLGALELVDEVPRAGRAIKCYRTVADEFVVDGDLLPDGMLARQLDHSSRRLAQALAHATAYAPGSMRIYKQPDQHHATTIWSAGGARRTRPDTLHSSLTVALSPAEAAKARRELEELQRRWIRRSGRNGEDTHLLVLGIAPLQPD